MSSSAEPVPAARERLRGLIERLAAQTGFAEVVHSLAAGHGATLGGVWGSSCALAAAAIAEYAVQPLVIVLAHADDLDDFCDDWSLFSPRDIAIFPTCEPGDAEQRPEDASYGERLRLLKKLASSEPPRVVATCIQALLQPTPRRQRLVEQTRSLRVGQEIDVERFLGWLVERGYHATSAVELPGEFSRRGGIVDLFAIDWYDPVRIELFGDQIESLRRFEVASQRSLATLAAIDLTVLTPSADDREHFCGYLPAGSWFYLFEPSDLQEEGRRFLERLENPAEAHALGTTFSQIYRFPSAVAAAVPSSSYETTCHLKIESVERFSGDIGKVRTELDEAGSGQNVSIVCQTEAEVERLRELFATTRLATEGRLDFSVGRLKAGFRLAPERMALVSGNELFHRADLNRPARRRLGKTIDSFLELREGDYVVHLAHGIARYRGLRLLEKEGQVEEHLVLEFAEETKIYVPASKINLVQKYVGGSKARPTLAKIGGRLWTRQKDAAREAVNDLAADMLRIQAARAARPGIGFTADTTWQKEFDASFPYLETPDQLLAIRAIKDDMLQPRPMDRLLCGDVGFGKTEVAMRAAFKAIDSGYQVAVLAPTTVLAAQHLRTFSSRMAEFPFTIRSLSRFCTAKEERETVAGLADGSVDLVIGTHRLAQADIRFRNLGLLVIDEEQRFGVEIKERLKALRTVVDVLTMTATPIPRTLHMALLGVRDISNLETPPSDRIAIETRITRFEPELVRHAILRELNREGQVFFVHNRVHDIELIAERLRQIVPEAAIRVGHGQMPETELEEVMLDFVGHKFDILVATTIVESGLDIPNANTMFIDEADHYGLADLHQLRGRVGRYKHRAYCYLLLDPRRQLTAIAAKRLRAIEEFSDMGSGFAIAMRDLELRGAGNILGTQQSGHIASVGYELYCDLLDQAVRELRRLPPKDSVEVSIDLPGQSYIPRTYVPDLRLKIDLYRRLNRVAKLDELADLATELVDRFGPRPPEVDAMLAVAELRVLAHAWGVASIHLEDGFAVLGYANRAAIERLARRAGAALRIVDDQSAYVVLPKNLPDAAAIGPLLKSLLRAE